jgi:transmembrane sensor
MEDDRRLAERAAEWITVLPDSSPEERVEFLNWIKESPRHLEEFLCASAIVIGLDNIDLSNLIEQNSQQTANIVHLPQPIPVATQPPILRSRQPARWRLTAVAAAVIAVAVIAVFQMLAGPKTYTTGVGEQRTVQLEDGSIIQLNAGSKAEVLLTDRARVVRLLEGEAMFNVRQAAARPFRVYTGTNVIQVLGTQFNVLRRPSGTMVSVIEGKVQILASRGSEGARTMAAPTSAKLEAGEEARIGLDGHIEQRAAIDVARVAVWRRHRLDFRADKLLDIAAEFNRYNESPRVIVAGDVAAGRRYSGVFDANDPRSLAEFLREDARLVVEDRGATIAIRAR